ncbi:hypothetical protein [Cohnella thailandensis]|uniref:DUF2269 domain-containing protein n=1 Tax=Cohnella thailandensis TaxID=557557 RepID=A0A841SUF8_9BACL|nr:hypothetical protein [Cohnella thailandensis]MBB6634236.1 hypothetical protein [Cohnella thailandensis]MBP1972266.1 putative membrane protein [Cohnella thailandensis]
MAYKLGQKKKQLVVAIHVIAVASWIGGTLGMILLAVYLQSAANGEQLAYTLSSMEVIDENLLKYPALLTLLTGILLSLWTQWGLVKHYWIVIKLALTVITILLGIFFLDNWTASLADLIADMEFATLQSQTFQSTWLSILIMACFNLFCLLLMVFITYYKPFGRIKKGKGKDRK